MIMIAILRKKSSTYAIVVRVPDVVGNRAVNSLDNDATHNNIGQVSNVGLLPHILVQSMGDTTRHLGILLTEGSTANLRKRFPEDRVLVKTHKTN